MKPKTYAPKLPSPVRTGSPGVDIVVPCTTRPLTRAALTAAERLSAELLPLIRMVHPYVVPFPLDLEAAPISGTILRKQFVPLAEEFGAHLQLCFTRDPREGLLHALGKDSVVLIAAYRRPWSLWWPSREERLARWLSRRGYFVMLEYVEKNNA